jgi:hypothetical protein
MHPFWAALLTCLLCLSCSNLPSEPALEFVVERPWGFANGATQAEALTLADHVEQTLALYRQLEGFQESPLRAHIISPEATRGTLLAGRAGITVPEPDGKAWIAVTRGNSSPLSTCAHELAHFYFPAMHSYFSQILAEGICELQASMVELDEDRFSTLTAFAAESFLDEFTIQVRSSRGKKTLAGFTEEIHSIEETLTGTNSEYLTWSSRTLAADYGLGWMIAKQIGWEGLKELVQRAKDEGRQEVPLEWTLKAADISPPDQAHLRILVLRAFGLQNPTGEEEVILKLGSVLPELEPAPFQSATDGTRSCSRCNQDASSGSSA